MRAGRARLAPVPALAVLLAGLALLAGSERADGAARATQRAPVGRPPAPGERPREARSAAGGTLIPQSPGADEEDAEPPSGAQGDPLVANGLGSPSCRSAFAAELDPRGRRDCETSGFVAAPAPSDDYGLDVHIDTGLSPLSSGNLLSTVQGILVTPEWLALVWLVHALVVMLEWAFALDLIDSGASRGLAAGLSSAASGFTTPLLALALAAGSILVAYHGLVRRRVAQTLGEVALTLVMLCGGFWVMVDPSGTVGALGRWSDRAALGVLAVAAQGSPSAPGRALGTHLSGIFAAAVEAPWCYLEFGNVAWCREAGALEPGVRRAGLGIAAREVREAGCAEGGCSGASSAALLASARMLREARTNGALFLALPPNGPARNSINDEWSLLRALCGGPEATACKAPGAAEAEFRTNSGTWPRVAGLILIAAALAGMLLLFGYVAVRLLTAALMSVLFLLLVPGVVLAPAFGERGRALFRSWAARLFGALIAKLVFAFLLGVLFAVTSVIESVSVLGWWAQWLLLGAFWWASFLRRHELLAVPPELPGDAGTAVRGSIRGSVIAAEAARHLTVRRERRRELSKRKAAADVEIARDRAQPRSRSAARPPVRSLPAVAEDHQARRLLAVEARLAPAGAARANDRIARRAARAQRLETELGRARAAGQSRRAVSLELRAQRLSAEADADELARMEAAASAGPSGDPAGRRRLAERARHLDAQAALRGAGERGGGARRDYPSLAGLARLSRAQYNELAPAQQRIARLQIDRELTARRERLAGPVPGSAERRGEPHGGPRHDPGNRPGTALRRRPKAPRGPARRAGRDGPAGDDESPVMRDARAVADGRKRQLGYDRP